METEKYSRDFSAQFRLATIEELSRYKEYFENIRVAFRIDGIAALESNGEVEYIDVRKDDENQFQVDALNSFVEDDEYDEDEEYYEDEDEDDYDYEYDRDDDCSVAGIIIANIDPTLIKDKEAGEFVTIGEKEVLVIDKALGLIALADAEFIDVYDLGEKSHYLNGIWENICSELEEKFGDDIGAVESVLPISEEAKEDFKLSELDFNKNPNTFNQIITGETGCGKTYKAINDEIDAGRKFAYIAPCRQLAYESYRYYADSSKDTLSSGEIKINNDKDDNFYGVFESMSAEKLKEEGYDTLIIDEAHFVKDRERGNELMTLIAACREYGINVKLLTATQNFSLNDFEEIHLVARYEVPEKKEIDRTQAMKNIQKGMQTIWFCGSIDDTFALAASLQEQGINAIAMNSSMTPSERMQAQIDFENKDVQVICCTNVLAQGVNFECENLIIECDPWETPEQLLQKIGRLGRPGTLQGKNEVYFCTETKPKSIKKDKNKIKIEKHEQKRDFIEQQLENAKYYVEHGYDIDYNDIKYCIPQFREFAQSFLQDMVNKSIEDSIDSQKSFIESLEELLDLTLENVSIHSGCRVSAMSTVLNFLDGNKNDIETDYINKTLETLTCGDLRLPNDLEEIRKNSNHIEYTLPLLEKLQSKEGRERLTKVLKETQQKLEYFQSEEYREAEVAEYREYYSTEIETANNALAMIDEEQEALKNIILNNMRRTPNLNIAEELSENDRCSEVSAMDIQDYIQEAVDESDVYDLETAINEDKSITDDYDISDDADEIG